MGLVLQTINRRSCTIMEKAPTLECKSASRRFQPGGEGPALVGAFSVIVKTNCVTDGWSAALSGTVESVFQVWGRGAGPHHSPLTHISECFQALSPCFARAGQRPQMFNINIFTSDNRLQYKCRMSVLSFPSMSFCPCSFPLS